MSKGISELRDLVNNKIEENPELVKRAYFKASNAMAADTCEEKLAKWRKWKPSGKYLSMSKLNDCARSLWIDYNDDDHKFSAEPRMHRVFTHGFFVEYLVFYLMEEAGIKVTDKRDWLRGFDGHLRGQTDGRVKIDGEACVLEIKSSNANRFAQATQYGIKTTWPKYYAQAQTYMGFTGMRKTLFAVYSKNDSDLYFEMVPFDEEAFLMLKNKASLIIKSPVPMLREFDPEFDFTCRWCHNRDECLKIGE